MAPRKPGRPKNPDFFFMRTTLVRDDPAQMQLLEESGHTHAEAYRIGSRILTNTRTPATMKTDELKEAAENIRIEMEAAAVKYQALLSLIQEAQEEEARTEQARKDIEAAIETASRRLFEARQDIRNDSTFKKFRINAALEVLPPNSLTLKEISDFFKEGVRPPGMERILEFIKANCSTLV